jgi:2-dehydro-3-deoxyphosphogluconate aldolase / (4S)-4-hydroxy-2-oxoglutarate aldolase
LRSNQHYYIGRTTDVPNEEGWNLLRRSEPARTLREICVIAAVRVIDEQQLLPTVAALVEGGIRAVELSYTTVQSAGWLVQSLKEKGLLVGVGSITRSSQAREAGMLGADFVTATVTTPDVVSACKEISMLCILSALTPTEIWRGQEMGADFVRVVAEALGGPNYIRSLRETLPVRHIVGADMPLDGYLPYLEAGTELLEFGRSLAPPELVERENWPEISRRALRIVKACDTWRGTNTYRCLDLGIELNRKSNDV